MFLPGGHMGPPLQSNTKVVHKGTAVLPQTLNGNSLPAERYSTGREIHICVPIPTQTHRYIAGNRSPSGR